MLQIDCLLSFLYVCMVNTIYLLSFVETPPKFIIAELSIRKLGSPKLLNHAIVQSRHFMYKKGCVNSNSHIIIALMKIRAYGSKALQ